MAPGSPYRQWRDAPGPRTGIFSEGRCHFSPTASTRSPKRAGWCESCPSPWVSKGPQHVLSATAFTFCKGCSVHLPVWLQEGPSEAVSGLSHIPPPWVSSNHLLGSQYKLCPFIWRKGRAGGPLHSQQCCVGSGSHKPQTSYSFHYFLASRTRPKAWVYPEVWSYKAPRCLDSASKALKPYALKRILVLKKSPLCVLS